MMNDELKTKTGDRGEIVIYKGPEGLPAMEVRLEQETVWLTQKQMAALFDTERSVITKHLRNVLKEGELERESVCAKFAHTAEDGKVYQTVFYNLDAIISVGYRVNSKHGTQFRIWATQVLDTLAHTGVPTRAEVTDAAMAMRAECVMLNKGPYVGVAVRALADIICKMEMHQYKKRSLYRPLSMASSTEPASNAQERRR